MDTTTKQSDVGTTYKLTYVEWVDAVADAGWEENTKAVIHPCKSVGWLISETDEALCLANTISQNSSNARIHIPKAWIKNRKVLKIENFISQGKRKNIPAVGQRSNTSKVQP